MRPTPSSQSSCTLTSARIVSTNAISESEVADCPALPRVYDPPLGQPGVLTTQPEAGYLSLQRPLKISSDPAAAARLFDSVHGYGWQILNLGAKSAESLLSEEARAFFIDQLNGKCVCISHDEDNEGEYKEWLAQHMAIDHFVLVRPDFYVFGHASAEDINKLVGELQAKITA